MGEEKLFGTDGVRGVANVSPMTPGVVMRIGMATGLVLRERSPHGSLDFIIGRDTRLSGAMVQTALTAGLTAVGVTVRDAGVIPTPGISFLTQRLGGVGGAMISASHNPYPDNGVKLFSASGTKLPDEVEDQIEVRFIELTDAAQEKMLAAHTCEHLGDMKRIADPIALYSEFCREAFGLPQGLKGIKIVVDCANGASWRSSPSILKSLGAQVITLADRPDGTNINVDCGSLHPEQLVQAVKDHRAQVGIAHDGDADRVILVDETGDLLDGDKILGILAREYKEKGELVGNTLVATIMSNVGLVVALKPLGIRVIRTQVGDRYVKEEMEKKGYTLGGEQSGHIILGQHAPTGDGLITALEVLKVMVSRETPLSELARFVRRFPQVLLNVPVREKRELKLVPGLWDKVLEIESALGEEGRVVLRYSGTEPLARVMVEGPDEASVWGYADTLASRIKDELGIPSL